MIRTVVLQVWSLWWREMKRFWRQPSRVVGAVLQPIVFWLLLGMGLNGSFRPPGAFPTMTYMEYFYPGVVLLVLLFTAIFSTISTIEDRRQGFLQGVLVAPISPLVIVLGQCLGSTTLALLEGAVFLLLAGTAGIKLNLVAALSTLGVMAIIGMGLSGLGLTIAWRMESTQGFHAIMNLILIPSWLLSGAFFPVAGVPSWFRWIMQGNPLTYDMGLLRSALYMGSSKMVSASSGPENITVSIIVAAIFTLFAFACAVTMARREASGVRA